MKKNPIGWPLRWPKTLFLVVSIAVAGCGPKLSAQSLLGSNPVLPQIHARALAWADYDGDGDMDLFAAGMDSLGLRHSYLLRNDNASSFTSVSVAIPPLGFAAVAWADLDGDGDPDLVVTGDSARLAPTNILLMNIGGVLVRQSIPGQALMLGSVTAADLDADGDKDLVLTGWNPRLLGHVVVLKNDGLGAFSEIPQSSTPGLIGNMASVGDMDGDGDLDLLLNGIDNEDRPASRFLRNTGGLSFQTLNAGLVDVLNGNIAWADYDGDGDLDAVAVGFAPNKTTILYNRQLANYIPVPSPFPKLGHALASWCNFDPTQNGSLDLALCGDTDTGPILRIYRNTAGVFVDVQPTNPLPPLLNPRIAWADWNGDGYIDFAVSGIQPNGAFALFLARYNPNTQQFEL